MMCPIWMRGRNKMNGILSKVVDNYVGVPDEGKIGAWGVERSGYWGGVPAVEWGSAGAHPADTGASVGAGGGGRMMYLLRINEKHKG